MTEFIETDGKAVVYEEVECDYINPTSLPAEAKSKFANEHDVEYNDLRATTVAIGTRMYVIVGECNG